MPSLLTCRRLPAAQAPASRCVCHTAADPGQLFDEGAASGARRPFLLHELSLLVRVGQGNLVLP